MLGVDRQKSKGMMKNKIVHKQNLRYNTNKGIYLNE